MDNKYYAQIKDGVVVSVIVLNDDSLIPLFSQGFDYFFQVTRDAGSPSPGWSYDPVNGFTPPIINQ